MDKYNQQWVLLFSPRGATTWGITLGQTTYYSCAKELVNARWRRHEDKHKDQWRSEGIIGFAVKYSWYSLRYGYYNNPYEIEARAAEDIGSGLPQTEKA